MRALRALAPVVLLAPLACGDSVQEVPTPEQARSNLQRANPSVPASDLAALVNGNTKLTLDVYGQLRVKPGNVFFSAHSIVTALAMTYAGARGPTATEMAAALRFGLPDAQLHPAFNALDLALTAPPASAGAFQLQVNNALWGQKGLTFVPAFLNLLATNYGAGMNLLDYIQDANGARKLINAYISAKTNALIPELIPEGVITSDTRLVLTNAIYFKADWKKQFERDATYDGTFTLVDGTKDVPMMHGIIPAKHAHLAGYDALSLPYVGDRISMLVLVPDAGTFDTFDAALSPNVLSDAVSALSPTSVELSMPKFSLDQKMSVKEVLQALGMHAAFDGGDFSGITTDEALQISDVVHQAVVKVNEKGTEAAAATAVVVGRSSIEVGDVNVRLDRPFLFFIRDDATGEVLFSGRLADPS